MLILESKPVEKKLVLGDYVTVHVSAVEEFQSRIHHDGPHDVLVQHEAFFQRIVKDRRELSKAQHRKAA